MAKKTKGGKSSGLSLALIGTPGARNTTAYVVPDLAGNRRQRRAAGQRSAPTGTREHGQAEDDG